jgi:hypothetical protein
MVHKPGNGRWSPTARPVFSLTFMGGNVKTANIVSAINGKRVQLEIIARDDQGKNEVTPLRKSI